MFDQLIIAGNVGRDTELRTTQTGQTVATFSLATSRKYKVNGESREETKWFRVTCWGKQAETAAAYIKKGMKVLVIGRLVPDAQTGGPRVYSRNDGTYTASFEVTCQEFKFLDSANSHQAQQSGGTFSAPPPVPQGNPQQQSPQPAPQQQRQAQPMNYEFDDPNYFEDIPF